MTGAHWFLDDEPNARFPVYCRGNVGEIVPRVATPMSATVTTPAFQFAFDGLFRGTGAFSDEELAGPAVTGGIFGGYLYFNLSFARAFAARAPGMRVADIDLQMFGSSGEAPPFRAGPGDRSPRTALRTAVGLVRTVAGRKSPDLDAERAEIERWLATLPAEPDDAEVVALTSAFTDRFAGTLGSLLEASFGGGIPSALLERLCGRAERKEPGILVRSLSGLGAIETTQPALDLWRLGRQVAADPGLTGCFDAGGPGVLDRVGGLAADSPAAVAFLDGFTAFLATHGHRGPNEVELASETWGTSPESVLAVIERLRLTGDEADPEVAGHRLAAERDEARTRLLAVTAPPARPLVRRLLASAERGPARREQAKGTLVRAISGLRRVLFHAADRLVAEGSLPDRQHLFMATASELPALLADPAAFTTTLAERRQRYDELDALVPPFVFDGALPDPVTWPRRDAPAAGARPTTLTGIGVSSGRARGRARVITDPRDPRGIEPGEVLVAPLTDPAWTPLFLAAAAVVVDVGARLSHAAIVARELGVPAVVSVEHASSLIADGDELDVDGDRGVVTVLSRAGAGR
jgi:rifampicin phosphotransferase